MVDRKPLSAKTVIAILTKVYGFRIVSQRGSHIKLRHGSHTTIVPNHQELAAGTLRNVLRLAGVDEKDFWTRL